MIGAPSTLGVQDTASVLSRPSFDFNTSSRRSSLDLFHNRPTVRILDGDRPWHTVETVAELRKCIGERGVKSGSSPRAAESSNKGHLFWIDVEIAALPSSVGMEQVGFELSGVPAAIIREEEAMFNGNEVIRAVQHIFGLHAMTVGDITDRNTLDKVEIFEPDYTFVIVHEPNFNEGYNAFTDTVPVAVVLLADAVVSVHAGPARSFNAVKRLVALDRLPTNAHVFAGLIASTTSLFGPLVDQLETDVKSMCEIVLLLSSQERADLLRRLASGRRHIALLGRSIYPKRDVIRRLIKTDVPHVPPAVKSYIRDPWDHATRITQQLKAVADLLESALDMYNIKIGMEMSELNNRINVTMRRYAAVTTIMLPLTLITGILGMNVPLPSDVITSVDVGNATGFYSVVGILAALALVAIVVFRTRRII